VFGIVAICEGLCEICTGFSLTKEEILNRELFCNLWQFVRGFVKFVPGFLSLRAMILETLYR